MKIIILELWKCVWCRENDYRPLIAHIVIVLEIQNCKIFRIINRSNINDDLYVISANFFNFIYIDLSNNFFLMRNSNYW